MKRSWKYIPFCCFMIIVILIVSTQKITGLAVRSIPFMVMIWLGAGTLGVMRAWKIRKAAMLAACMLIISAIIYEPEHTFIMGQNKIVERSVGLWHRRSVYYEYKNALFNGKRMKISTLETEADESSMKGQAQNVLESEGKQMDGKESSVPDLLNTEKILRVKDKRLFDFTADEFIAAYNRCYSRDYQKILLNPVSKWQQMVNGRVTVYRFKEDMENWRLPAMTLYVPFGQSHLQMMTVDFDDHSYSEESYDRYETYCFYALKILLPDLQDDDIIKLYTTLNQIAYDNVSDQLFNVNGDPTVLYVKESVGLYPSFVRGDYVHLCIVPVDQQYIDQLGVKKIKVYDIDSELEINKP